MQFDVWLTSPDGTERSFRLHLRADGDGKAVVRINGRERVIDYALSERDVLSLIEGGRSHTIRRDGATLAVGAESFSVTVADPRSLRARKAAGAGPQGPRKIIAPMPGKIVRVLAPEGAHVALGAGVVVIEAMKMQNEMKTPKAGVVKKIAAVEGATVNAGDTLAIIE